MKSYKPRITEPQARESLTIRGRIFKSRKIVPHKLELIYLPHYFFKIIVRSKQGTERKFLTALDAILGGFSMVDESAMEDQELESVEFQPVLSKEEAEASLLKEVRWFLHDKSLRGREKYSLAGVEQGWLAWYPFWVAYYQNKSGAWEFLGLDAVSGVIQGGRGRRLFIHAFANTRLKSS